MYEGQSPAAMDKVEYILHFLDTNLENKNVSVFHKISISRMISLGDNIRSASLNGLDRILRNFIEKLTQSRQVMIYYSSIYSIDICYDPILFSIP